MISFSNTIQIDRPPAEVFAYLADLEHTPEWNWAIVETRKTTSGPVGIGTRYRQVRSTPRRATEVLEIAALDPGQHIEVRGTLAEFAAQLDYRLSECGAGTELTNAVNLETQGALRLISPLLGASIKRAVADNLGVLKTRLES